MNSTKTQDELIRDLPPEISNLLFNTDMDFYLLNLLSRYGISDDSKMLVVLSTRALLVGDIAPTEFVKLVSDVTGLDQAKASLIAQDINRDIFNPVKDALKLVHGAQKAVTPPPQAIPTPYQAQPVAVPVPSTVAPVQTIPKTPVAIPTPPTARVAQTGVPPQIPTPPASPVMPRPPMPLQQPPMAPVVNNLEAKLGGAFTIKKDVMFTQPGTLAPLTPVPNAPLAQTPATIAVPQAPQPPQADPYRELPS